MLVRSSRTLTWQRWPRWCTLLAWGALPASPRARISSSCAKLKLSAPSSAVSTHEDGYCPSLSAAPSLNRSFVLRAARNARPFVERGSAGGIPSHGSPPGLAPARFPHVRKRLTPPMFGGVARIEHPSSGHTRAETCLSSWSCSPVLS